MALGLLLAFILIPLLEIAVFIQIGGVIGLGWTLGLILLTAVLGSLALRLQGLATLSRARLLLDRGELPAKELFDGFCLVIAGVLLLTPGFVTDTLGALLFLPPLRDWLRGEFGRRMTVTTGFQASAGDPAWAPGDTPNAWRRSGGPGPSNPGTAFGGIIDGDFVEIEEPAGPDRPSAGQLGDQRDDQPLASPGELPKQ